MYILVKKMDYVRKILKEEKCYFFVKDIRILFKKVMFIITY